MTTEAREQQLRQGTYLTLTGLFLSLFGLFARREQRSGQRLQIGGTDLLLLVFAVFRGGRMIAWDHVMEPLRAPFTQVVPDASGIGENVEPRGEGPRQAIGQLLSCPICSGTWVAAFLVYGLRLFPGPTRLLITILGAIGAAEFLNAAAEAFSWQATEARQAAGRARELRQPAVLGDRNQVAGEKYPTRLRG